MQPRTKAEPAVPHYLRFPVAGASAVLRDYNDSLLVIRMAGRKQVFVAYPARDQTLADGIMDAVRRANALPLPILYRTMAVQRHRWLPARITHLEKIDESPFVVADISYLNLNVVYEIGFTIGKCKPAFWYGISPLPATRTSPRRSGYSIRSAIASTRTSMI